MSNSADETGPLHEGAWDSTETGMTHGRPWEPKPGPPVGGSSIKPAPGYRRYKLEEVQLMRKCVRLLQEDMRDIVVTLHVNGDPVPITMGQVPREGSRLETVEEQLRTYMLAGVDPQELYEAAGDRLMESYERKEK